MNFTVLGASGFIGRHLVAHLRAQGYEVYAPARDADDLLTRPLGHVLYCIGLTADFRGKPFATMHAHVGLLTMILERAQFDSLLYLSSTRVYAKLPEDQANAREDAQLNIDVSDPSDLYNISKLAGEALCHACTRGRVRIARLSNIVGHDQSSQNFAATLIRQALAGRIDLLSDLASSKDYLLIDDLLELLPRLALSGKHWIYNVASGHNLQHWQVAERLVGLTGCKLVLQPKAPLQIFPPIDIARVRAEFDFMPKSVLDGLPSLVQAYREPIVTLVCDGVVDK